MAEFYTFIQTPVFSLLLDKTREMELLEIIEEEIVKNPEGGSQIKGGMRKLRVASPSRSEGKSGGYRVWFFHQKPENIYLLFLLDKREAGDLTPDQEKVLAFVLKKALEGGRK